jgi:MFS family permease
LGGIVAVITTTSEFGFLVFLPTFFTESVGFTLPQWLRLLSIMFATNVGFNLLWGVIGDKIGWQKTVAYIGACGCAVTTLGLYYIPHLWGHNYPLAVAAGMAYGAALAGFVPISAIMASLAPESRGAAMSIMNLGSGLSIWLGPALVGLFLSHVGVAGLMWIFAAMYAVSAVITLFLTVPPPEPGKVVEGVGY